MAWAHWAYVLWAYVAWAYVNCVPADRKNYSTHVKSAGLGAGEQDVTIYNHKPKCSTMARLDADPATLCGLINSTTGSGEFS